MQILQILWDRGPSRLSEICTPLRKDRSVATTTVATMLSLMARRGLVRRIKQNGAPLWLAKSGEAETHTGMLKDLVDRLFDGSTHKMVAHLLEQDELRHADRRKTAALLRSANRRNRQ